VNLIPFRPIAANPRAGGHSTPLGRMAGTSGSIATVEKVEVVCLGQSK
jgi:hypothetical protein